MHRRQFARSLVRSVFALGALAALGASAGCVRWTVIAQAAPSPFSSGSRFAIEPMHWETTRVGGKSEADYFAGKDDKQRQSYETDRAETAGLYAAMLQEHAEGVQLAMPGDPQAFIVRPIVDYWEPGFYVGVAREDSRMNVRVQILAPGGGAVLDEIGITSTAAATMVSPSTGGRMRHCGKDLGGVTGRYLSKRTEG